MLGPTSPRPRLPSAVALLASLLLAPALGAAPASAQPEPGPAAYEERPTPARHYATLMAEQPEGAAVVVDDALAGLYDLDRLEAELHDSFDDLGVPYHVVAGPFPGAWPDWDGELLPALSDRVGADGVYVLLQPGFSPRALSVGGELPVDLASDVVTYSPDLEYDAPLGRVAEVFTEALVSPDLPERAERLREAHEHEAAEEPTAWDEFLEDLDPGSGVGPGNLGFLSGSVAGGLLAATVLLAWYARRRGAGTRVTVVAALPTGIVLPVAGVVAALVYMNSVPPTEDEVSDPLDRTRAQPPHVTSLVRVERVLGRTGDAPLYVDPLSRVSLEGLAEAAERAGDASVPVHVAVVPMADSDESGGDPRLFAHAMHHVLGEDGVYAVVTADYDGTVRVAALPFGLGMQPEDLIQGLGQGFDEEGPSTPAVALETLLDNVEDAPRDAGVPDPVPTEPYDHTPEPRIQRFWPDFLGGFLLIGPLVSLPLAGVVLGLLALTRRRGPSPRALRRTAETERARLASLLSSDRADDVPPELMPQIEAALMIMDADPDDLDLLGVAVVSRRAHAALEDPGSVDTAPCEINPLHGPATTRARSRAAEGRNFVSLCRGCADLPDTRRVASVPRVRDARGVARSYLSLDDRAWVRYRFGTRSPGRMAERLLEDVDVR
ncbi:hypothetical protein [Nocardiopsis halotolerans]|uniref:hypothetical protein n=1 Tax=Nocardiopsis halotolerans TaxID=124252 RepID=UPI0003469944|nr:hypothetical protein [Nocardiopsis halotolerans]